MSYKQRSYQPELLDGQDIPFEDIKRNMLELDFINRYLGGHKITINGLKKLLDWPISHIAEIGCGGGDNLRVIKNWFNKQNRKIQLSGVDINSECIAFAKERPSNKDIKFFCSDYKQFEFDNLPDIIFSSLFCHHFSDEELVYMMKWMYNNSKQGFFINDLHRHPLAYHSIKWLSKAFSKSYLVKHDAPLSVKKGLLRKEWENIFSKAGLTNYQIKWQWAFRWLIIYRK